MINELPEIKTPKWLVSLSNRLSNNITFPLDAILKDSLYYPASGLNGTPIKFLAGNILSFVYADYGVKKKEFLENMNGTGRDCGFLGYHSVLQKEIYRSDIVPNGWNPKIIPTDKRDSERLLALEKECEPFGHWSICKEILKLTLVQTFLAFYSLLERCPLFIKGCIAG